MLTGFDAPLTQVLYIDKELKEHGLLQAIARTNRLREGKEYGLIVDYRGLIQKLDAAMDINYKLPSLAGVSKDMSASLAAKMSSTVSRVIEVPLNIDAREIARATAWDMGEQLAWEQR